MHAFAPDEYETGDELAGTEVSAEGVEMSGKVNHNFRRLHVHI